MANGLSTSLTSASGGIAADNGFTVSTSPDGIVLGFSFTGAQIPVGQGVLTVLNGSITGDTGFLTLDGVVLSDALGASMDVEIGDPFLVGDVVLGCTDSTACNYDSNANIDDGSCDFTCYGCTDSAATNYDPYATIDDGSCFYQELGVPSNLVATGGDSLVNLSWGAPSIDCDFQWDLCVESLIGTEYYDACSADDCDGGPGGACDGNVVPSLSDECCLLYTSPSPRDS